MVVVCPVMRSSTGLTKIQISRKKVKNGFHRNLQHTSNLTNAEAGWDNWNRGCCGCFVCNKNLQQLRALFTNVPYCSLKESTARTFIIVPHTHFDAFYKLTSFCWPSFVDDTRHITILKMWKTRNPPLKEC